MAFDDIPKADAIKDLKWFLLVLAVVGIVWFVTGGPMNPTSTEGPFLEPPTQTSRGFGYGEDRIINKATTTDTTSSINNDNQLSSNTTSQTSSETKTTSTTKTTVSEAKTTTKPAETTTTTISTSVTTPRTAYNLKFYSGYGNAQNQTPSQQYLQITLNSAATEKVLLTGLVLKSVMTGKSATIGQGVYLPFIGGINANEQIYLNPGDTVYVVTGRSPNGYSFKINKCSGYFEQFQNFYPSINLVCPKPSTENMPLPPNALSDNCLTLIENLYQCQIFTSTYPTGIEPACKQWIADTLNYSSCIVNHKDESDFYKSEWRVYLNQDYPLWKSSRELIELIGLDGKVIDTVSY